MTAAADYDVTGFGFTTEDLPPFEDGAIDVGRFFFGEAHDAARPLELEIGSGKGTFLAQHAPLHPGTDFVGIEYARKYWRHAADRLRRHAMPNARMLHAEAEFVVRNYVPDASLAQVHIYFPDPWPKARHNKRRLVQAPFLRLLHTKLKPGGRVRLATDHADYFAWMLEHIEQVADLFVQQAFEPPDSAGEGELVGTNFERKYRREGRVFNGVVLVHTEV